MVYGLTLNLIGIYMCINIIWTLLLLHCISQELNLCFSIMKLWAELPNPSGRGLETPVKHLLLSALLPDTSKTGLHSEPRPWLVAQETTPLSPCFKFLRSRRIQWKWVNIRERDDIVSYKFYATDNE